MSLKDLRAEFLSGRLPKAEYIERMHAEHARLYEYAEFLRECSVGQISIVPGEVRMKMWDTGIEIIVDPRDHRLAPIDALNFGAYEEAETQMMKRLMGDDYSVVDIGANIGWYSLILAKKFPAARIHAFEPIPATFAALRRHIEINRLPNVTPYNFGFSEKEDNLEFFFYPEGSVNASLADVSGRATTRVTAHVKRLDEFAAREKLRVDFIKCDVEGAELLVFKGAMKTIAGQKPVIFTEMLRKWSAKFNYHPNEIIDLIGGAGYHCFTIREGKLARFGRMDEATIETNFFFLHPEKHAKKIAELS